MIKAVIFDLDDLMVDHHRLSAGATGKVLEKYGHHYDEFPLVNKKRHIGMRVIDVIKDCVSFFHLPTSVFELYKERMEIFLRIIRKKVIPRSGIKEVISLCERLGLRLAVASSGAREYIDICLKGLRVKDKFEVIISGDDVKKGKPDPETYRVAIERLGLRPSECLVLEDAEIGVEAAKRVGAVCIGVVNPKTPKQNLQKADLVVGSLEEIDEKTITSFSS
jgi:HAD superfamily hydrolase (TIGR01509 family)